MTCLKKNLTARDSDLIPKSAVNRTFIPCGTGSSRTPDFPFIIGIFGEILYKHFLLLPGPDDLERCLKVRNTLQSATARRLSHISGIVKL